MSRKGLLQLDTVEYGEAWKLQKTLLDARVSGKIEDCLVLLQHPPPLHTDVDTKKPI